VSVAYFEFSPDQLYVETKDYILETFNWRSELRFAVFRMHPSGRELIAVGRTGRRNDRRRAKR
jgi:hypothetical protein